MLGGILILVGLQLLLLLPNGFEWLDTITGVEVDAVSKLEGGVPFYYYGQFIRFVEI